MVDYTGIAAVIAAAGTFVSSIGAIYLRNTRPPSRWDDDDYDEDKIHRLEEELKELKHDRLERERAKLQQKEEDKQRRRERRGRAEMLAVRLIERRLLGVWA